MIALLALVGAAEALELNRCDEVYSVPGTARFQVAMDARESTSQLFGAAGFAEDVLFPAAYAARGNTAKGRGYGVAGLQAMELFGGVGVASLENPWDCPYGSSMRSLDMYASSFGAAGGIGPVSGFVSTGATAMVSWNQSYLRNAGFLTMPMVMGMAAMAAPLWIAADDNVMWQNDPQGIFADFIVGAQLAGGPAGTVSLGWSGTQGPYANYTNPKAHAEASVALSRGFKQVPYALLGFRGIPLPGSGAAGNTSIFARQFGYQTAALAAAEEQVDARSVHLEQLDLANGTLDIRVAALIQPDVRLNEARIGIGRTTLDADGSGGGFKIVGGVFDQPDYWFWGVQGGMRPTVVLDGSFAMGTGMTMKMTVGYNDPGLLRVYPYAVDSFSGVVSANFGGG